MFAITKKFRVEYAHVLMAAYSTACTDSIHGHSGIIEVTLAKKTLNADKMVVDFGLVKDLVRGIVMKYDHALVVSEQLGIEDQAYMDILLKHNKKMVVLDGNPTAELMAQRIFDDIADKLEDASDEDPNLFQIMVQRVRFQETETGWAEYSDN